MKVEIESSRIIKPSYELGHCSPPSTTQCIPLSVFDNVNYCGHMAVIYAYHPPTPTTSAIKQGLERVLSIYREWAGRLGKNSKGETVVFLNDEGIRLVEASVDGRLDPTMLKPSPALLTLHPSLNGEELVQVQLTRFGCGSLVVGFTAHHLVADGTTTSNFLVAWGKACRGVDLGQPPMHNRTVFVPRDPPRVEYEHNGIEYLTKKLIDLYDRVNSNILAEDIVVTKVHFTLEFLSNLKNRASSLLGNNKKYSTFESLLAHLWRCQMKARGLGGYETTQIRISVNGRKRLNPRIPNNYFGNLVLWAFPKSKVKDLLNEELPYATKTIHDAVSNLNGEYFQSFIDYASTELKEAGPNLVPSINLFHSVLASNLEVDSWLGFPFYDLDFGCGSPYMFMPSYFPTEGTMFLLPSFMGDGSIDAFIPLYKDHVERFMQNCYVL